MAWPKVRWDRDLDAIAACSAATPWAHTNLEALLGEEATNTAAATPMAKTAVALLLLWRCNATAAHRAAGSAARCSAVATVG